MTETSEKYRDSLHKAQQNNLLEFISKALKVKDFAWAFDLYTIYFVLFPDEFQSSFLHTVNELSKNDIENNEFESSLISFTIEKLHLPSEPSKLIHETISVLLRIKQENLALRFFKAFRETIYYENANHGFVDIEDFEIENEGANKKLKEAYSEKEDTAIKVNRFCDEEFIIEPTELERSEAEFYLSQNVNALLITIGRTEAIALGAEFSPETAKNKAEGWLDSLRAQLRKKICEEWSYGEKRNDKRLKDKVILATTIGNLIVPIVGQVPPLAVACLLVNIGIEEFCGNDKK